MAHSKIKDVFKQCNDVKGNLSAFIDNEQKADAVADASYVKQKQAEVLAIIAKHPRIASEVNMAILHQDPKKLVGDPSAMAGLIAEIAKAKQTAEADAEVSSDEISVLGAALSWLCDKFTSNKEQEYHDKKPKILHAKPDDKHNKHHVTNAKLEQLGHLLVAGDLPLVAKNHAYDQPELAMG